VLATTPVQSAEALEHEPFTLTVRLFSTVFSTKVLKKTVENPLAPRSEICLQKKSRPTLGGEFS
jgi:hypothetical protein